MLRPFFRNGHGLQILSFLKKCTGIEIDRFSEVWNFWRSIFQKNRLFSFVLHKCDHACMEVFEGLPKWLRTRFVRIAFELIRAEILLPVKIGLMLLREAIENSLTMQCIILSALFDVTRLKLQTSHNRNSIYGVQKSLRTHGRRKRYFHKKSRLNWIQS